MMTTSEIVVTIAIWILTLSGCFFGLRAAWRRLRRKADGTGRHGNP